MLGLKLNHVSKRGHWLSGQHSDWIMVCLWDFTICVMTWKPFPRYWPLWGNPPVISGFPSQNTINAEVWCSLYSTPVQAVKQAWNGRWFETSWRTFDGQCNERKLPVPHYVVLKIVKPRTMDPSNWLFVKIANRICVLIDMFNAYNTISPQQNLIFATFTNRDYLNPDMDK